MTIHFLEYQPRFPGLNTSLPLGQLCKQDSLKKRERERKKNVSMGNDWLRQRKEIRIHPREEAEASKDSDRQINSKRKKWLKIKKISGT